MSLIRKHGAVLQAWACLDLVRDILSIYQLHILLSRTAQSSLELHFCVKVHTKKALTQ